MNPPNPDLLRSLGHLSRGLSALFWGLPAALLVCAETARANWLKPLEFVPPLAVNALLLYGLWLMGRFRKQERAWRAALDRAMLLGMVNLGLSPFFYWQNKLPDQPFFNAALLVFVLSSILFLFRLNVVLKHLGAMLPDETLRNETRLFTAMNRWLLSGLVLCVAAHVLLLHDPRLPVRLGALFLWINRFSFAAIIVFALLPLAMTMALIWKTKEVILDGIFGTPR